MSQETQHQEINFEKELAAHLAANDWLYSENDSGYSKALALFPDDVIGWLEDTQPEQLSKVIKPTDAPAIQEKARKNLLIRLGKALDADPEKVGGTLRILRNGFKDGAAKFTMAQFRPAQNLNQATLDRYKKVRVRVVRQVFYSEKNKKSLDLVLFVNGIPVSTVELKTDFTQNINDAEKQYQFDRNPAGELLFKFGSRSLVHFIVSNYEVKMTTKLAGSATTFLPLNKGADGRAGNPLNPDGNPSAYFWEEILQKDTWLNIIGKFMHLQVTEEIDPDTGEKTKSRTILFPRYHQLRAVNRMVEAARAEGPGQKYLIQHSAGSGKTNSIAWTAHQLSSLHDAENNKVFDTVIVVTDRTVLDKQLQDAIYQIDHAHGVVIPITRESGESKSKELTTALVTGAPIVIVTIQTFLPALDIIKKTKGLSGKSFAIIADEAHSSQTGSASGAVKKMLTATEQADLSDGGEIDTEAYLAAAMEANANADNISYFAFTATPKAKTIELFGRAPVPGAVPVAFDVYTMQQAIEEKFILDVLHNYTPYKTAWRLAHNGQDYDSEKPVDEQAAVKGLLQWVKLHPTNISQKVRIIVEHFRENVAHHLDGKAKAMVVTGSRKEAVRYKKYLDLYIHDRGYANVQALVAFSGTVDDAENVGENLTEATQNPGLKGRDLAEAFKPPQFNVMIVANKFQTGFDQPRLVAMYVDKKLSGVTAVQTLSRLNRMTNGKTQTFVLDFVNEPSDILDAFKPYFKEARLANTADPNLIHDLQSKLDSSGIYTDEEVVATTDAWVREEGNAALTKWVAPARKRFIDQWVAAVKANDKSAADTLELFRSDLGAFIRYYDFISQIINYEDTDLYRRQIYFRLLLPQLRTEILDTPIDVSAVQLSAYRIERGEDASLDLNDGQPLRPISAIGTGLIREEHRSRLAEIIEKLNQRFEGKFTEESVAGAMTNIITVLALDKGLEQQGKVNTDAQFKESTVLPKAFLSTLLKVRTDTPGLIDEILADDEIMSELARELPYMLLDHYRELTKAG